MKPCPVQTSGNSLCKDWGDARVAKWPIVGARLPDIYKSWRSQKPPILGRNPLTKYLMPHWSFRMTLMCNRRNVNLQTLYQVPLVAFAGFRSWCTFLWPTLPNVELFWEAFLKAQLNVHTLIPSRRRVTLLNSKPQQPGADVLFPLKLDLLYRVIKTHDEVVEQLVVPQLFKC